MTDKDKNKKIYEKIIVRIDFMISQIKYDFLDCIPANPKIEDTKSLDINYLLCSKTYYTKGLIDGLERIENELKQELKKD